MRHQKHSLPGSTVRKEGSAISTWDRAVRLNSTDEMLANSAGHLGSTRIVQVLWRFPMAPLPEQLLGEWRRLDCGRLSRVAVSPTVPGARRRWAQARNTEPLAEHPEPLTEATALAWADAQVRAPLRDDTGALWRLSYARLGAGALVSLTVPHFRSDGLGVLNALGDQTPPAPPPTATGTFLDDLADAAGQVSRAALDAVQLVASHSARTTVRAALRSRAPVAATGPPRFFSSAYFELDAAAWQSCAEARGGTVNSLFVEMAANIVRARIPDGSAVLDVGVPMSIRQSDSDGRANALAVVPLPVPRCTPHHDTLAGTRRATRTVLTEAGRTAPTLVPEALWHLLPSRIGMRLKTPGAQQTDVVASNFGTMPDAAEHFAGGVADVVAVRTMNVPGVVPELARLRASLVITRLGDRHALTVTGMADHFGDADDLARLVTEELAGWGLSARRWL